MAPPPDSSRSADPRRSLAAGMLEYRERAAEAQTELRLFESLRELGARIIGSFSLQTILQQIPPYATRELGWERAALFLDDRGEGVFWARTFEGITDEKDRASVLALRVPANDPAIALMRGGTVVYTNDAPEPLAPIARTLGLAAMICAPLIGPNGKLIGFLAAGNRQLASAIFSPVEAWGPLHGAFTRLAQQAGWAITGCILHWDLAIERNMLEARVAERTHELEQALRRIQEDLEHAREFQQSILSLPPAIPGLTVEVEYHPLELVGGDLYDLQLLADGRVLALVADATGHGVDAALATMFIKSEYENAKRAGSPAAILRTMNDSIARLEKASLRFTAVCMLLDLRERRLRWASAAHPALVVIRDGGLRTLDEGGPFLGMAPGLDIPEWETELAAGDTIIALTDGVLEARSGNQVFGETRTYELLRAAANQGAAPCAAVFAELRKFAGAAQLGDDVTLMSLRVLAP